MKFVRSLFSLFRKKHQPVTTEAYVGLRDQVFELTNGDHQVGTISDFGLYAVLLETGYPHAVVTLVAVSDGSASLYFSNGGGIIGAGIHESVRDAVNGLLLSAPEYVDQLQRVERVDLPSIGEASISFVTKSGLYTISAPEDDFGLNRHRLSPLFHEAHGVISAIRMAQPQH